MKRLRYALASMTFLLPGAVAAQVAVEPPTSVERFMGKGSAEKRWRGPLSVDQVEAEGLELLKSSLPGVPRVPFGHDNDLWEELKAVVRPGDELYWYSSPPSAWRVLKGREGYVLVRSGQVIAHLLTGIS